MPGAQHRAQAVRVIVGPFNTICNATDAWSVQQQFKRMLSVRCKRCGQIIEGKA